MQALESLFGTTFGWDEVAAATLVRMRLRGAAALVAGSVRATLSITLKDGRSLRASARGEGAERDAIEAVSAAISEHKTRETLAALGAGDAVVFGDVLVTPGGLILRGRVTRWDEIAGYAVRQGGLMWDDAGGRLAGEVWLARTPFGDALCRVVRAQLPGKDYDAMAPGTGPRHGFFSVTARTRIPGAGPRPTQLLTVAAILLLGLGLAGASSGMWWLRTAATHAIASAASPPPPRALETTPSPSPSPSPSVTIAVPGEARPAPPPARPPRRLKAKPARRAVRGPRA